jgi:pyridoxine 5'-phosphate synthase PdxJ
MTTDKLPTELERLRRFVSHPGRYDAQQVHAGFDLTYGNLRAILARMEAVRPPVGEEVVLRVRDAIRRVKEERHAPITGDEELEARAAILAMQSNG